MRRRWIGLCAAAVLAAWAGCDKSEGSGGEAAAGAYAADASGLTSLFTDLRAAAGAGDADKAAALSRGLIPSEASIKKALKDDAEEAASKIAAMHASFAPKSDADAAKMFAGKPERSEVQVHASTTEDLIAYKEGTPAYAEFPGGARSAAQTILRPGLTFYEVELLEPGKDSGMKYHLLFHDGEGWRMLGPVWRALR